MDLEYKDDIVDDKPKINSSRRVLFYFSASIVQGALAFVALPITTTVLGPADYGIFAVATSLAVFLSAAADFGQNTLFSGHYATLAVDERRSLFTTAFVVSLAVSTLMSFVFVWIWPFVAQHTKIDSAVSTAILLLVAASIPFRAIVSVANQYLAISDRSGSMAILVITQSVSNVLITVTALFAFHAHVLALFLGNVFGLVITAIASIFLLKESIALSVKGRWLWDIVKIAPASTAASVGENLRSVIENIMLGRFSGAEQVGFWAHSKQYHGLLMQATNAVAYVLWPRALGEARTESKFETVGKVWGAVYVWLTLAGVFLALFGSVIVSVLTNGKFVASAPWIPLWVAYLLLQNAGKAATATIYAHKKGVWAANFRVISLIPCLVAMWLLIPRFGISGAMLVLFAEALLFRLFVAYAARKLRQVPFQDGWVFLGCLLIICVDLFVLAFSPSLGVRSGALIVVSALIMGAGREHVQQAYAQVCAMLATRRLSA